MGTERWAPSGKEHSPRGERKPCQGGRPDGVRRRCEGGGPDGERELCERVPDQTGLTIPDEARRGTNERSKTVFLLERRSLGCLAQAVGG